MSQADTIPLFPLSSVLMPGGRLPLRIFEQRYLDMVRECARQETGFGVCLVTPASGENPVQHVRIGTLAIIRDFYTLEDGLLGITAEGARRFRIIRTHGRDNGLLMGDVEWLEESPAGEVPESHALLSHLAERFMEKLDGNYPDYHPGLLQDANWVSYRLTEWLPLELPDQQLLLEITDPVDRLQHLLEAVPRIQAEAEDE